MPLPRVAVLVGIPLVVLLAACGDGDDGVATPSPASSPSATGALSSPVRTAPPAAGTVDGTVAPQNPGATDPVTTKPNPDPPTRLTLLKDVRIGIHPENGGWERIVFEFEGGLPPAEVEYLASVAQCGSGAPVAIQGPAILNVTFQTAAQHTDDGQPTFAPQTVDGPGTTILEAKQTCDFEAVLAWAIGLKAQQNFKVTTLQDPPRLVIDVKQ